MHVYSISMLTYLTSTDKNTQMVNNPKIQLVCNSFYTPQTVSLPQFHVCGMRKAYYLDSLRAKYLFSIPPDAR